MANPESISEFISSHSAALLMRLTEHLTLTVVTIFSALFIGIVLAMIAYRHAVIRVPLLIVVGLLQTIPGIALLVMAMGFFGHIGIIPALFALILYALLPIVQNTLVGLNALAPSLAEVARGLGLNRLQHIYYIRLPIAMPVIMAGVRIAAVQTVGLATLAAFIGAGGLGQFINRGLFLSDTRLILLGAVPAAAMALCIHGLLSLITLAVTPGYPPRKRFWARTVSLFIISGLILVVISSLGLRQVAVPSVTVGSKNFTEQLIVAEMVAQQIERHSDIPVRRQFGLGGSTVVHRALRDGTIDMAVEYTGTALTSILHLPIPAQRGKVFPLVQDAYQKQFDLKWLPPLGFDNSYRLAIRDQDEQLRDVKTITALTGHAANLKAAFDFEFAERDDGYKGLKKTYGLQFQRVVDMHPDVLYPALLDGSVDVICVYTTDGRIAQSGVRVLQDDRHFFPPYEAAVVVRSQALAAYPDLEKILRALSGTVSDEKMREMNAAVDRQELTIEDAAKKLLVSLSQ